jgi:hypothetical protein
MEERRARVQADVAGAPPEQVLVLEIAGSVGDFVRAVQRIQGAEWLGEVDETLEPDEDFYVDEAHLDSAIGGQLFLVMSNQEALNQIISLWRRWLEDPDQRFAVGLAPWKSVFAHLRDIRPWEARDRVVGTGIIEDWRARLARGQDALPTEIELWFRADRDARREAEARTRRLLEQEGARTLASSELEQISYHALLAEVPAPLVPAILEAGDARLVRADDIMFFRPTGQAVELYPEDAPLPAAEADNAQAPPVDGDPLVALLDGLPLENHELLAGRLVIDDPDGWAADYPPADRVHGTSMASLIIRGDGDAAEAAAERPLYSRPIMRPGMRSFDGARAESVPDTELFVDLLHRAVIRIFGIDDNDAGVANSVRIINLSVCDRALTLGRYPSPLARTIDWLSWQYGVLFVVSAGNYTDQLTFQMTTTALDALTPTELEARTLSNLTKEAAQRGLLTPAESINALTVAAAHADAYGGALPPHHRNLIESPRLLSPLNALGLGFRRAVKPDILLAGGRQLYSDSAVGGGTTACTPLRSSGPPGQRSAAPGPAGELSTTRYSRGTSNAAARASRQLAWLYDQVISRAGNAIDADAEPALLKALLVHSASWDGAIDRLEAVLGPENDRRRIKDHCARLLGYGAVDESRLGGGNPSRVVLFGTGILEDGLGHAYAIPLPPSLSGEQLWRRVTVTLAWATPIHSRHRSYRRAQLWLEVGKEALGVERLNAQWQTVRRGTVQHEVLDGERAAVFADGDALPVQVNCKSDAGELTDQIPYALVVTIEAAPLLDVSIYEEVADRVRPRVAVIPQA